VGVAVASYASLNAVIGFHFSKLRFARQQFWSRTELTVPCAVLESRSFSTSGQDESACPAMHYTNEPSQSLVTKQSIIMKRKNSILLVAGFAAALVTQGASAQTVTVQNSQSMGLSYNFATAAAAQQGGTTPWKPSARNQAGTADNPVTGIANKIWLDFDLSSAWAAYGQSNLVSATLTLWGENGPTRRFDVAGLNDGTAGETTWTSAGLTWANAPGNNVASGYKFDSSTIIYQRTATGVAGPNNTTLISQDPTTAANSLYDQCARYISGDISSFLAADSNGRVTLMIGDGLVADSQNWWAGVAGSYDVTNPIYFTSGGDVIRD
jgi:hypothetical protein